jgi:hypothetical protein
MATYVNNLRLKEITTGDEDGTWGTSTNTNLELITDGFSAGVKQLAADADETFTMPDGTADDTRSFLLAFTSAVSLTATRVVTLGPNTISKVWIIDNLTSGGQSITIKQGTGGTVNIPSGAKVMIVTDGLGAGAGVFNANPTAAAGGTVTSVGGTGTVNGITLTGTVTSSGNLTLGGTLANVDLTTQVTGTLPVANGGTGITSFGAGIADWLGTPSSANLATAVTDETGSGLVVFNVSPALTSPAITTGINDANTNEILKFSATGSAVNEITLANAAAGGNPSLSATGTDTNVGLDVSPKGTGEFNVTTSFMSGVFSDRVFTIGNTGTAQTIDCDHGNVFTATLTGNCTFTLATPNGVSNRATSFTLILTNDATADRTVVLSGGTFKYPGGSISRSTGANEVDIWFFFSPDGGTTWYVTIPAKNLATS